MSWPPPTELQVRRAFALALSRETTRFYVNQPGQDQGLPLYGGDQLVRIVFEVAKALGAPMVSSEGEFERVAWQLAMHGISPTDTLPPDAAMKVTEHRCHRCGDYLRVAHSPDCMGSGG